MRAFLTLLKKDFTLELRKRETLAILLALAVLLAVIVAFGVESAFLSPAVERRIFPLCLWIIFVFASTVSVGWSYGYEEEYRGIDGLLLSGVPPAYIYCAKTVSNFCIILTGHAAAVLALAVLLNVELFSILPELVLISVLVTSAYSALATLIAVIAVTSRLNQILLPLVLLPLLFPLFFAALETTTALFIEGYLDPASFWFTLLITLNVVYVILGVSLYRYVVK